MGSNTVMMPTIGTLRKYALSVEDWRALLDGQGGVCAICGRVPKSRRLAVDHQHVRGWKHMSPADRRRHVRGLVCFICNGKCVSKHMTIEKADAVARYLRSYQERVNSLFGG